MTDEGGEVMPRAKKDGKHLNCYLERELVEKLISYADERGQTVTTALERILKKHLDEYELSKSNSNSQ